MSRGSDARLHEELVERIGRQQHLQPILESGENIDWETGVSCLHSVGGESSPVQEGFIALSDRRFSSFRTEDYRSSGRWLTFAMRG